MITIRYGSRGQAVKKLQELLRIGNDGKFGRGTYRAVKAYQKRSGLLPDGVVGFSTWKSLFADRASDYIRDKVTLPKINAINLDFTLQQIPSLVDQALPLFSDTPRNRMMLIKGFEAIHPFRHELELDTPMKLLHFLAQIREEVGRRIRVEESLNYRCSSLKLFKYYRLNPREKYEDGRCHGRQANQFIIACKAYGGRMGNARYPSADGWRTRGRGSKMTTGTNNYRELDNYVAKNHPDIYKKFKPFDEPDLLMLPEYWLFSGAIFWKQNGLSQYANDLSFESSKAITEKVNRWTQSYNSRFKHLGVLGNLFNIA